MMRAITRGIVIAGAAIGAALGGAGTCVAEPAVPSGTYQGTTTAPAGELIWKGKTFQGDTVVNNFVFGLTGLAGTTSQDGNGNTVIDYSPSGLGFLTDRISPNADGSYTGAVYVGGSQVGSFGLSR
ncbi:hypothetical protein [Rhodococcus sp. T7]|uniref:hypothetical protein n=1 Tax=Rhodococcus sp. T7 TaxID=627444 RepID=UPI0013C90A1C|nr:hypothetical protein [Rhodococcus sp. T7]KAF0961015.1 hypothetical protein MLGJGCBP_05913 [Rhodococcus sp. T7]